MDLTGFSVELGVRAALCGGLTISEFNEMASAVGEVDATEKIIEKDLVQFLGKSRATLWSSINNQQIEKEIARCNSIGIKLITFVDNLFPKELAILPESPTLLYVMGAGEFNYSRSISVVGSRRCSSYGRDNAYQISADLAKQGGIVYSGLARGIDTFAHKGALDEGGATVAVMGRGLAQIYPSENKQLAKEIAESPKGLLVSEYALDSPPLPYHFPRRNRLISALSRAVVVIEGGMRSGTLSTVNWALDQGREVFALPGRNDSPGSELAHYLIRDGATLLRDAEDIISSISDWQSVDLDKPSLPWPSDKLDCKICKLLLDGEMQSEDIYTGIDAPRLDVMGRLTMLEVDGLLKKEVGGLYRLDSRLKS